MSAAAPASPITRADIEAKLRELQGGATQRADAAANRAIKIAAAVAVVVVVSAFLIGRRKGRHQTTIVEIRRV
ncbi:MAG TPA: hypothetical protein VK461_16900 [Acidimicrobiales bacterium]|nr:hypothetical protein [Acidimicrobiales bacterium]